MPILQEVDERRAGRQGLLQLLGREPLQLLLPAKGSAFAHQLDFQFFLLPRGIIELPTPDVAPLGIGTCRRRAWRGDCSRFETRPTSPSVPAESVPGAALLPGQAGTLAGKQRSEGARCGHVPFAASRQVIIELVTERFGHGQLLPFGKAVRGQVELSSA